MSPQRLSTAASALSLIITFLTLSSCGNHDPQPTLKAFEGNAARLPPEGTFPVGEDALVPATSGYPEEIALTEETLRTGQALFERNCVVCHGRDGRGQGIAVNRGLTAPPSFHAEALRGIAPAKIVDTLTRGKGRMPAYARRLTERERWVTAAFVKTLQLSQDIKVQDLDPADREKLP